MGRATDGSKTKGLSFAAIAAQWRNLTHRPIRLFVVVSAVFGMAFIILVPPFQIPDEYTHFTRAYEVSELKTAQVHHEKKIDHLGSMLPSSIYATFKQTTLHRMRGLPDVPQAKKYHLSQSVHALHIPLNKSAKSFYDTGSTPSYFPLLYAPQAILITILQFLNAPVILMLYATRFLGLLIWLVLAVLALKIARPVQRKFALVGIMTLPMFVAQASASTDPLINGLAVMYVALIVADFLRKTTPSLRKTILLILMVFIMTMSKPVYAAFGLLFFLLPGKHRNLKDLWYKLTVLATPLVLFLAWSGLTTRKGGPYYIDAIAVSNAAPSQQVHYLVANGFHFVEPFINTVLLGWGDNIYTSFVGEFGKLDTPLPLFFVVLGYVIILLAVFAGVKEKEREEQTLSNDFYNRKKAAALVVLTALGYLGGVYLAMYVYSTPPGTKIITGVQGRYFLPLLPLGVLLVSKKWVAVQENLYRRVMTWGPVALLIASVVVVYARFYILYPR